MGVAGFAQITESDEYIKVIGEGSDFVTYTGIHAKYRLLEIMKDNYGDEEPKSIPEVESDFMIHLEGIELDELKIKSDTMNDLMYPYGSDKPAKHFIIELESTEQLLLLSNQLINGFKLYNYNYVYDRPSNEQLSEIGLAAIEDALSKAILLAETGGRELGEVLSIKELSQPRWYVKDPKSPNQKLTCRVEVTYQIK